MKSIRRRSYKQKFQPDVMFEAEDDQQHSIPTPTVEFDFAGIDARETEEREDKGDGRGKTRDEMESFLRERGLSQKERAVVLARVRDCKSTRAIAAEVGLSKSRVGQILRRGSVRECLKQLVSSLPLPPVSGPPGLSHVVQMARESVKEAKETFLKMHPDGTVIVLHEPTLSNAMGRARRILSNWPNGEAVDPGHLWFALDELGVSDRVSETEIMLGMIAVRPELLLHEPKAREILVRLLKAARYGKGTEASAAAQLLKVLIRGRRGNRSPVPDRILASESLAIRVAFADLQEAWRAFRHDRIATRLEGIREQIGDEHKNFSDKELQSLLNAELPTAAARVAEKATGISRKAFLRAWRCKSGRDR